MFFTKCLVRSLCTGLPRVTAVLTALLIVLFNAAALSGQPLSPDFAQTRADVPVESLIVEGKSIGALTLGTKESEITRLLGKPSKQTGYGGLEFMDYESKKIVIAYPARKNKERPVIEIYTHSPSYRTKKGIHVGSSVRELESLYGKPDFIDKEGGKDEYIYSRDNKASLRVTVSDSKVFAIGVSAIEPWWRK